MLRFQRINPVPRRLHGTLLATIYGVDKPLKDRGGLLCCTTCGKKCLDKVKRVLCGSQDAGSRIYVKIELDRAKVAETMTLPRKHSSLKWNQLLRIYCAHTIKDVVFIIKEEKPVGAREIGRATLPVEDIIKGFIAERWLDIIDDEGLPLSGGPKLHVMLQFGGVEQDSDSAQEITSTASSTGVPYAYFNQREGCRVTLYQDAHVPDDFRPHIPLETRQYDSHRRCWEDLFDAISNAKLLVYITGWSVYTKIALVRDSSRSGSNVTLGELLKRKADEGVTVLLLLWDFSKFLQNVKLDRQMGIHDVETYEYFEKTNVRCVLCPRRPPDNEKQKVAGLEISTIFTHHQKSVIVDCEMLPDEASQKRRIVSFIGGLDLCDGRYDTPDHPLFKTLDTVHHDDFHQPNFRDANIKKGGPREPWHDIHCRLEGPIAWDVLYNFEQRWRKVTTANDFLVPRAKLNEFIVHPLTALPSNDNETWNVRLFRSIDTAEAYGFPDKPEDAAALGLTSMKDHIFDRSIQDAYINAIRRAKHFVYIENQYFCGSSFAWRSDGATIGNVDALQLVPRELSLKIVSKIEAGERFAVYVVIPMWPEGIPESDTVQEILDWQRRTMEMMYNDIEEALRRKDLKTDPREYLTFFCLGNREIKKAGEYEPPENPESGSDYAKAQHSRRFMVYVHAKMMIVDDEYIIIGSANLNQRSMDGTRDTEIAMGAYQPYHLATKQPPRGQIHGFRMSLWHEHLGLRHEHLGLRHESFANPQDAPCVHLINKIADYNWKAYASDSFDDVLQGHLLRYPVAVGPHGAVTTYKGTDHFPDTNANILGKTVHIIPPVATT